eukprot:c26977_g1_i1 orf=30-227(+)
MPLIENIVFTLELRRGKACIEAQMEPLKTKHECTMLCDGWPDMQKRPDKQKRNVYNVLVSSCKGT